MKLNLLVTALVIALSSSSLSLHAQDATSILKKMDEVMYSATDMTGKNRIILIDKNGKEEVREAMVEQKGNNKRMFRFTSPASQAGISVLSLPDDVMYLYLPAFGRERRIATSAKNQNFAGTDFSYYDMESKLFVDKYNATILQTEAEQIIMEFIPKTASDYSKIITKVHKTNFYPMEMEYFDKGGNKVKQAVYTWEKAGKYWNAAEIEMTDLKKNHRTKMQMDDSKYDTGLSEDVFSIRNLKR